MKIFGVQSASGYSSEKSEKQRRVQASKSDAGDSALLFEPGDDLELTGKKAAVLNSVHESNIEAAYSAPDTGDLSVIRQKLMTVNNRILNNPFEALSAQANLTTETVAGLIG
jgi:gamma-glutamylcysteine synthetase